MKNFIGLMSVVLSLGVGSVSGQSPFIDTIKTDQGDIKITLLGHASVMLECQATVIYVDPFSKVFDVKKSPKADLILITHDHPDHLDLEAIAPLKKKETVIVANVKSREKLPDAVALKNNEKKNVGAILVEAVPAYNIVHKRDGQVPFHPRGEGNGYVITLLSRRIYIAGDTENIPEMKELKNIHYAFLPINLPYTMDAGQFIEAVRSFKPGIVVPYHYQFGQSELPKLESSWKADSRVVLRVPNRLQSGR